MTRQFELIEKVKAYNPGSDEGLLSAAYVFGMRSHAGQFRKSGEEYWVHPVAVADILTGLRLDDATIVTALLHDTVEDTGATLIELRELFGDEVAELVDGVTKLTKLQLSSTETEQAENLRKLFFAMSRDVRVLLVKLADRLHNMRTIGAMRPHKQEQKARETMEIYAPLAGRMGMQKMREELEDLSFTVLDPESREDIIARREELRARTGDVIEAITGDIKDLLAAEGIDARVYGREKRPFSIWRKMQQKGEPFSRLSDIYGFRIITRSDMDCYRALGAVHRKWRAVPTRFKDYISQPKDNGYRSIHTTVSGRDARRVEVQIRTEEMHEVAETGIAAHWAYKNGAPTENRFVADPFRWLRDLSESFETAENPDEFLEHVKLEMFQDQVFCFTPKGKVIKLPRGATPIDFAYAIHTRIGDSCVGAKIDNVRKPLWTVLQNGQTVEVIRAEAQRPQPVWEQMTVTGRARAAIRRALRSERRAKHVRMGEAILRQLFERLGRDWSSRTLDFAAQKFGCADAEDLQARIGAAELSAVQVAAALWPDVETDEMQSPAPEGDGIKGLDAARHAHEGHCCLPVPGDRIIGIAEPGKGVTVHAIDCPMLAHYEEEPERWIDLRWENDGARPRQTALSLIFAHERGALARVCTVISDEFSDIIGLEFTERRPDFYRARVDVEVRDLKHLNRIVTRLAAEPVVTEVRRILPARESALVAGAQSWSDPSPRGFAQAARAGGGGDEGRGGDIRGDAAPEGGAAKGDPAAGDAPGAGA
ncbi:RelA/SpoT family protein [Rhodovulum sp. DZ06]|uniref:RelA/SpoT family protein n=1 Tax=Rhodovulum sp. DZ06 TaxID=3425126 RepID=UPI003D331801